MAELVGDTEKVTLEEATRAGSATGDDEGDADADEAIRQLLESVADGTLSVEEAAEALS